MGGFCRKKGTFGLFAVNTAADAVHTEGGHGWIHAQRKRAFGKGTIVTSSNQSVSAERGALKVFGVLFIVLGVVYLISGGVMIAGARVADTTQTVAVADGLDLNVMVWSLALAIWWLISGLFYIVFGALGIRGAKNPAKIGVFMVLAWILAIVGMISVVLSQLLGASVNWLGWIVFAVTVAAAIYATKIRKDARNA